MTDLIPLWPITLDEKPHAALIAFGVHGPNLTEHFRSDRHWWLHLYSYTAVVKLNGDSMTVRPGYVSLIPPGTEIEYVFGERARHLCAHFTLSGAGEGLFVPAVQDLGAGYPKICGALEEGAAYFAAQRERAEVRLWDILWQLADHTTGQAPLVHNHPGPVQRVREIIELRLSESLCIRDLAHEAGVSHNHLTRLFQLAAGDTVIGYIRKRRTERACHLLEHTTLPIKTIAAQVGVEDPRVFYKLLRTQCGLSPTQIRQNAQLLFAVSDASANKSHPGT